MTLVSCSKCGKLDESDPSASWWVCESVYRTYTKEESNYQFSSVAQSCLTLCDPMDCRTPGLPVITNSLSVLKLMSIESVMPSNHLILYRPLLLPPSIFPRIRIFSSESVLHMRWPGIGVSASASVLPKNIHDWFPLGSTGWISLQSKGISKAFPNTTVQKQFFSTL